MHWQSLRQAAGYDCDSLTLRLKLSSTRRNGSLTATAGWELTVPTGALLQKLRTGCTFATAINLQEEWQWVTRSIGESF